MLKTNPIEIFKPVKMEEKDDAIILRDVPWENWARGVLFFSGVLLFGAMMLIGSGKPNQSNTPNILLLLVMLFFLYWTYRKLSLPATVTRVLPDERAVEITKHKFLIIKKTERIDFSRVKRFELERRKPDRAFLYFNVLTLRDGSAIDLEADGNAVEGTASIIPIRLNEYLNKPIRRVKK